MKSITSWTITFGLLVAACAKSKATAGDALHAGDLLVQIAIDPDPPRAGENVLHVTVNDYSGDGGGGFQCCWTTGLVKVAVKP